MGTTLENGVYLPSEGERNCYAGLKTNWEILDQKVADVTALQQAVAGALHREIVESLPTTDIDPNTIYMTLSGTSATENVYNEFMYVNNAWELIGTSATDLTNYYTKAEVDGKLLLKANDSDVVHKSGNETISGDKVFNTRLIKNIDVVLGTAPSTGKFSNIDIADNNKVSLLQILGGVYDTGNSYARFFVQNKTADDGTGLSPTGTLRTCGFTINLPAASTSEGSGSITPRGNKTTDFGLVSYQWRNVWCEKLFLNGTRLEPSAFVTTDTAQTISGAKTFSSNVNVYNSDNTANTPNLYLRSSKIEISSRGNTSGDQNLTYLDKNNTTYACVKGAVQSNGSAVKIRTIAKDSSDNSVINELQILAYTNGNKAIFPSYSNEVDLGISSYKWKSFNGVEPSSLSLPSDRSARIDISSYFTNTGTGNTNDYSVPANGFIFLNLLNAFAVTCYSIDGTNNVNYAQSYFRPVDGQIYILFPVRKNDVFRTLWTANGGTITVTSAYFIPCQGNV